MREAAVGAPREIAIKNGHKEEGDRFEAEREEGVLRIRPYIQRL
jgi:hypothetical protein